MVIHARLAALVALAILAVSCRGTLPPAIDPGMASCVPAGTLLVAGLDLGQLRAGPLDRKLPLPEPLRDAGYLLLAFDGRDLLSIARGPFRETPPGAALVAPNLAIAGPPGLVRAATAQHKRGTTGAPGLLSHAEPLAAGHEIWIVAQGGVTLPLAGNAANLNGLLRAAEYVTITARVRAQVDLDMTGVCRTEESARQFEETVRGFFSLAAAAVARDRGLAARLSSVEVRRGGLTVHATLSAAPEEAEKMLGLLSR